MFADPVKNLRVFGLKDDDTVVDLGAGTGFYSIAAGRLVSRGQVYAVEIVKDFLDTIKHKIKDARLTNVHVIWGDVEKIDGTKLKNGIADAVIASNILFQIENKEEFIEEIKRILKKKGKVLFIDWDKEVPSHQLGMSPKGGLHMNEVRDMFENKGFVFQREFNAGSHHYGMILIKN